MPSWRECLEDGDLQGCFSRVILGFGVVFTALWLIAVIIGLGVVVWIAFIADPAVAAPDSLNRNSPIADKLRLFGFVLLLACFGVIWGFFITYLRRRMECAEK